jgi:hypothetical protein
LATTFQTWRNVAQINTSNMLVFISCISAATARYLHCMNVTPSFLRRIGPDPNVSGAQCSSTFACPDIWELEDGDFAIIGTDITTAAMPGLPATVGCASHERIIRLPRRLLMNAKSHIPEPE